MRMDEEPRSLRCGGGGGGGGGGGPLPPSLPARPTLPSGRSCLQTRNYLHY